jgi:hypothetical protein
MTSTGKAKDEENKDRRAKERADKEIRNESTTTKTQMEDRAYLQQEGYVTERYSE